MANQDLNNKDINQEISGIWHQWKGEVKQAFGKFVDDDGAAIEGRREVLIGRIQERYGYSYEEAAQALSRFINERYTHEPGVDPVYNNLTL